MLNRIQKEKEFHNTRFAKETRDSLNKFYSVSSLIENYTWEKIAEKFEAVYSSLLR